jgi:hypothetical protein
MGGKIVFWGQNGWEVHSLQFIRTTTLRAATLEQQKRNNTWEESQSFIITILLFSIISKPAAGEQLPATQHSEGNNNTRNETKLYTLFCLLGNIF